jgi:hypothetical protein
MLFFSLGLSESGKWQVLLKKLDAVMTVTYIVKGRQVARKLSNILNHRRPYSQHFILLTMEQHAQKNVNNCLNTNIYS